MNNRMTRSKDGKHLDLGAAMLQIGHSAKKISRDFQRWVQLKMSHNSVERRWLRVLRWRWGRRIKQTKRALRRISRRRWTEKVSQVSRVTGTDAWANLPFSEFDDNGNQYWQVDLPEHWQVLAVRVLHTTAHTLSIEVDWDVEPETGDRQVRTARRTLFIDGDWTVEDTAELVGQRVRVLVKPLIIAAEPTNTDETASRPIRAQPAAADRANSSGSADLSVDIDQTEGDVGT